MCGIYFSTLVAGRIWCLVNLDILDPKNTSLPLEWVHTLRNCLMNLRNPPAITLYSGDWPRVISSLVASSHWSRMSSITDFLSAMSLFHSWDLENDPSLRSEWCSTWGFVLEMGVYSTISELIGLLPDGTFRPMIGLTTPSFTWCLDGRCLLIEWSDKKYSCVGSMLVLIISEI